MDGRDFDDFARRLASRRSRRGVLKGLLGVAGGAAALGLGRQQTEAAWSTLVCLPTGEPDTYIARLVPTAAVPLYLQRYDAVLPENGVCPSPPTCAETCGGCTCVGRPGGTTDCGGTTAWNCDVPCESDSDCNPSYPICFTSLHFSDNDDKDWIADRCGRSACGYIHTPCNAT